MTDQILIENNWLDAGFTQIPNLVLRDTDLSIGARLLYGILLSYAWQKDQCWPGQERLATDLGRSSKTVRGYLAELMDGKYLQVQRRGLGQTNIYTLLDRKPTTDQDRTPATDKEYSVEEYSVEEDRNGLSNDNDLLEFLQMELGPHAHLLERATLFVAADTGDLNIYPSGSTQRDRLLRPAVHAMIKDAMEGYLGYSGKVVFW